MLRKYYGFTEDEDEDEYKEEEDLRFYIIIMQAYNNVY